MTYQTKTDTDCFAPKVGLAMTCFRHGKVQIADRRPDILVIDVGTSALKAAAYTAGGQTLAVATRRYAFRTPRPGWAQIDPQTWWDALTGALSDLNKSGLDLSALRAIGFTGQMHTAVLLDENGSPLDPTILWLDRRATAESAELVRDLSLPRFQLNAAYTLPKLLWLSRHHPEVLQRTRWILWPKDYLRYRLTGRVMTDVTEAAGAALLNWDSRRWETDRLRDVGLDPSVLPPLASAGSDGGPLRPEIAAELRVAPSARVIVGSGDVIALLGTAPPREGRLACSLGSSNMLSITLPVGHQICDPQHRLYVYPFLPRPVLNGVQTTGGAALTWAWRALYGEGTSLQTVLDAALAVAPGADGLLFLPFLAGERAPYWNEHLRGGFYGLTPAHGRPHMVRAVLEGVAFSVLRLLEISEELGVAVDQLALAGGGATVSGWPQIFANICDRPVSVYAGEEAATRPIYALCAAALDATREFQDALAGTFEAPLQTCLPEPRAAARYASLYRFYRQISDFVASLAGAENPPSL